MIVWLLDLWHERRQSEELIGWTLVIKIGNLAAKDNKCPLSFITKS